MRLPALDIVAVDLDMADRLAKRGGDAAVGRAVAHRQLRDLVVEVDEALDDHAPQADAGAGHRVVPGARQVLDAVDLALALARRGHDRLDHAGQPGMRDGRLQLRQRIGEAVGRGRQPERFGGEPADALAVHRQVGGARGGDHLRQAVALDRQQFLGGDGLDLRHDDVRALLLDEGAQRLRIGHVEHVRAVGHLVAGGVGIAVGGDHLDPEPLQRNDHFLAQFAGPQQQHAQRVGRQGVARARAGEGVIGGILIEASARSY
jgi:hypothetical protein